MTKTKILNKNNKKEEIINQEENEVDVKTTCKELSPPTDLDIENLEKLENSGASRLQIVLSFIKKNGIGLGTDLTHFEFASSFLLPHSSHEYYSDNMAREFDILLKSNIDNEIERLLGVFKYILSIKPIIEDSTRSPLCSVNGETKSSNFHVTIIDEQDKSEKIIKDNYYMVETFDQEKAFVGSCIYNKREGIKVHFNTETKTIFNGTNIKLPIIGNITIRFEKFNEEYTITNPTLYGRYLRGFVEYCGETTITSKNSKYYIKKTNLAKPLIGGNVNMVEAKLLYGDDPNPLFKINGAWSNEMDIINCKTKETKLLYKRPLNYLTKIIPDILPTDSSIVWKDIIEPISKGEKINISKEKSKILEYQKKLNWKISQFYLNTDNNIWEPIIYKD
ncbi:hypothetical protein ACTFIY_000427 [Dictyostelium cf. discoideum]